MVFAFLGDSTTTSAFPIRLISTLARSVNPHEPAATDARDRPAQFQLEQTRQQFRRRQAGALGDRVEIARFAWRQRRQYRVRKGRGERQSVPLWRLPGPIEHPQLFQDIVRGLHNLCPVAQKRMITAVTSAPDPSTAIVLPPACSVPRCAAESTPRARPLTTTSPARERSCARRSATSRAYGDAARDPTIATAGALSAVVWPRVQSTAGGSGIVVNAIGYAASLHATGVSRCAAPRPSAAPACVRSVAGFSGRSLQRASQMRRSASAGGSPARRPSAASSQHQHGSSERATKSTRSAMAALHPFAWRPAGALKYDARKDKRGPTRRARMPGA